MRVEWTSYNSPIGPLTVVECEAGPLVVEFPTRALSVKWAVRLRAAVPELHIGQGTCPQTTGWLDEYFAGSPRPFPYPEHLRRWLIFHPRKSLYSRHLERSPWARPAPTTTLPGLQDCTRDRSAGWSRPTTWRS